MVWSPPGHHAKKAAPSDLGVVGGLDDGLDVQAKGWFAAGELAKGFDKFRSRRLQVVRPLGVADEDAVAISIEQLSAVVRKLGHHSIP